MNNSKHTPGPWSLHPYQTATEPQQNEIPEDGRKWTSMSRSIGAGRVLIAEVTTHDEISGNLGFPRPTHDALEANARLIASAPSMLAALKKIASLRYGNDGDCGATAIAESAISLAEDAQ